MAEELNDLDGLTFGDDGSVEIEIDFESGDVTPAEITNTEDKEDSSNETTEEVDDRIEYDDEEAKEEEPTEEQDEVEDENHLQVFANSLAEKGIVLDLDEGQEISNEDDLYEHFQKTMDTVISGSIKDADEASHGAVTHFLNGGTVEDFVKTFGSNESQTTNYTEGDIADNDSVKEAIAKSYYQSKGIKGKRLDKLVSNDVDEEEDDVFAEYLKELNDEKAKKQSQFKADAERQKAEKEKAIEEYRKTVHDGILGATEFVPGRKLDKDTKEKVFNNAQGTLNKINKDLAKYVPTLSFLDHYGLLDGNFEKIMKEVETKKTSSLSDALKRSKRSKGTTKLSTGGSSSISDAARYSIKKNK